jgi:hypothetical protein
MGWTNDRLDRATADLRDNLQRRVHPSPTTNVTAGAIGPLSGTPAPAVASGRQGRTARDLAGMAGNIAAARRAGLDPAKLWPGQAGLPGRPSPPGWSRLPARSARSTGCYPRLEHLPARFLVRPRPARFGGL